MCEIEDDNCEVCRFKVKTNVYEADFLVAMVCLYSVSNLCVLCLMNEDSKALFISLVCNLNPCHGMTADTSCFYYER